MPPGRILVAVPIAMAALLTLAAGAVGDGPSGVHLGVPTADPSTALSVVWTESEARGDAVVLLEGPGETRTVPAEVADGPSERVTYEARLDDLTPGTTYTYRVGDRAFGFTTPPPTLSAEGFTFVALGDVGRGDESRAAVEKVAELAPDLVLVPGDLSYAEGDQPGWDAWFDMIEPAAANVPWATALGNHETYPDGSEIEFYKQRMSLPGNEIWYSFDWQGVHFVALDTFSWGHTVPDPEVEWLRADLEAHADAPWTVVFLHEPVYGSGRHGSSEELIEKVAPLLEANGVDLVVQAHEHAYERTLPILKGDAGSRDPSDYPVDSGIVYVTTGGGGRSLYDEWRDPAPGWSLHRASVYHVMRFTVTPTQIVGEFVPTGGADFVDRFRIHKPGAGEFQGPENSSGGGNGTGGGGVPAPGVSLVLIAAATAAAALARARP